MLDSIAMVDAINSLTVDLGRVELQLKLIAYHPGQEAAHRVWLPACGGHHAGNSCA